MPTTAPPPALSTTWRRVLTLRLARQQVLERTTPDRLVDVVAGLLGLHAQVMSSAELQAAARIDGLRAADVRDALWEQRSLVKVWAFRQTLHLLTAGDLAEFVVAARSLERWHTPAWLRYFGLTESEVGELIEAVGTVLTDRPMTRVELVDAVTARVGKAHLREDMLTGWGTFLAPAAQRGQLIFGPSTGRNVAFVQPSAWLARRIAPADGDPVLADEALGRLIGRYLTAFPGSSPEMIARWWGGGRLAGVNRALARMPMALAEVDIEGTRGLVRAEDVAALTRAGIPPDVRLLPGFDPFTNELPRRVDTVLPGADHDRVHRTAGWVSPIVMVAGEVGGTWELTRGIRATIEVRPFDRIPGIVRRGLEAEADRIGAFLDVPVDVEVARPA